MSLIYCWECGKQISDQAVSCPHCGAGQRKQNNVNDTVYNASHNGLVLLIVCIFFGYFGIHRFAVGKIGTGVLMLFTFGGFGIWWLIDIIIILTGNFKDSKGNSIKL